MIRAFLVLAATALLLAGCAAREIKVSCEGKLVPINHPAPAVAHKEAS